MKIRLIPNLKFLVVSDATAAGALIYGGWKTNAETDTMDDNDKRNTLIVELGKISANSIQALQQFPTLDNLQSLVGLAYITTFLESKRIMTTAERTSGSYEDQRNILMSAVSNRGYFDLSYLQSLGDIELYNKGVQAFGKF